MKGFLKFLSICYLLFGAYLQGSVLFMFHDNYTALDGFEITQGVLFPLFIVLTGIVLNVLGNIEYWVKIYWQFKERDIWEDSIGVFK